MFSQKPQRSKFEPNPQPMNTRLTFMKKYYIIYIENNKGEM